MGDHYHYASEVQGAADEHHSHSPRDIGAAEDHDLNMLERRVQSTEGDVATLERNLASELRALKGRVGTLENENEWLKGQLMDWGQRHAGLQDLVGGLVGQVKDLTDALAAAVGGSY